MTNKIVFGPIPSRRLGQSLGINNIPPKICSYSCVYCQVGRTKNFSMEREVFYPVEKVVGDVLSTLASLEKNKEAVDFLTFVPDGEPTLDINLGKEIDALRKISGIEIAVITNASLLWREDVRNELRKADLVSVKIDTAGSENVWRKVDRPLRKLNFQAILEGIKKFSEDFEGNLLTETILIKSINDGEEEIKKTAEFLSSIKPDTAFLGIATRPPAEKRAMPPDVETVNSAYQLFTEYGLHTELITGGGGEGGFGFTGDVENDILNIVSVHPMSRKQVEELLNKAGGSWEMMDRLLEEKKIKEIAYRNQKYYLKDFSSR